MTLWLFSYGSLMNPSSGEHFLLEKRFPLLPVLVKELKRQWNHCAFAHRFVAVSTSMATDNFTSGFLLKIDPDSMKQLDEREAGYVRLNLYNDNIVFLVPDHRQWVLAVDIVFTYVHSPPKGEEKGFTLPVLPLFDDTNVSPFPAEPTTSVTLSSPQSNTKLCNGDPIVQSYVDVILGGLLTQFPGTVGERLGVQFLETTHGWDNASFVDDRGNPRALHPLADRRRHTRGHVLPELTVELEEAIDRLLAHAMVNGKSLLTRRINVSPLLL